MVTSIAKLVVLVVIVGAVGEGWTLWRRWRKSAMVVFDRVGLSLTEELAEVEFDFVNAGRMPARNLEACFSAGMGSKLDQPVDLETLPPNTHIHGTLRLARDLWDIGVALDELRVVLVWDDDADHRVKERPFHASPDEIEEATHRCALMPWPHDPSG